MSVLIRGMEMPKVCAECFMDPPYCKALSDDINIWKERHPDCPLVEISTPHGRLIDVDKLLEKAYWDYNEATHDYNNFKIVSAHDIEDAPPVIEAEGEIE